MPQPATSWQRTLYTLVFVQFVSAIGFSSIFPFLPLYVEDLGTGTGLSVELLAGLAFSAQAMTMMVAAPIWGALADRRGRKLMVIRATAGGSVIVALMGFADSAETLVVLRAVQGMVTGVFSALTALVAASVPRQRAGYALGLLQVGLWGGVSIGPLIGGATADAFGYRAAFIAPAVLLASAAALAVWGVEERFTPGPQAKQESGGGFIAMWMHVLAVQGVPLTYAARFLSRLGRSMVMPFMPLFVAELLPEADRVATITGLITGAGALAGTLGAVYLGRLGDRVGHRRVLVGAAGVAAFFYLAQSAVGNVWHLFALATLAGGMAGGIMPSISALLAGFTAPGEEGAVYGLESSIMAGGRAIAPMLGAGLVALAGLRTVYVVAGLLFVALSSLAGRWLPDPAPTRAPVPPH